EEVAYLGTPVERIDARRALTLLPLLRPSYVAGALHQPEALDIDVHGLHRGYLRALKGRDGKLIADAEVRSVERGDKLCQRGTPPGAFEGPVVVNAAGGWGDEIAQMAGVRTIGLQPKRRTAFTFDGPPGLGSRALPMCIDVQEQFYFKPE